ncbi:Hypothetical predicted protein [Podarcis lilfordi]|nr:Hypothetical predicted protein [Podarcis lilfordi]
MVAGESPGKNVMVNTKGRIYIGGAPDIQTLTAGKYISGITGGIKNVVLISDRPASSLSRPLTWTVTLRPFSTSRSAPHRPGLPLNHTLRCFIFLSSDQLRDIYCYYYCYYFIFIFIIIIMNFFKKRETHTHTHTHKWCFAVTKRKWGWGGETWEGVGL